MRNFHKFYCVLGKHCIAICLFTRNFKKILCRVESKKNYKKTKLLFSFSSCNVMDTSTAKPSVKIRHDKLPKDARPELGGVYTLAHNGVPYFVGEIVQYGGGCWATVRVAESLDQSLPYKAGDEFDIRVAMYEFTPRALSERED
jgi:hypothetical protein